MTDYLLIIPARYFSKRLPGKPLLDIKGIPMIIRTVNQCLKAVPRSKILIATDDKRIQKICENQNIKTLMTSKKCLTGTDRIAEVAKKIKKDFYINVQGDEPICNPEDIKKIVKYARRFPNQVVNGYTDIKEKKLFLSPSIPKAVFDNKKNLLYMSRSPIPSNKKKKFVKAWRQVCIYSFPYKSLKIFTSAKKKTTLESIEDLESNRFLELGYQVKMLKMSNKSVAVDTKEDLAKVRKLIKN
ncbi:3-deoxy-manno-octulosonate cytidylyltransferase [Candidatus Pelagibacter sp. Uisw_099_02]|uniref:3-deoxy-manno-octulosonate cytidylyltransferase n=1 Tax=Candidatus Pelagibacter sp. Uisw_099_02 TaxID=3230981 RepID=UPI0039E97621